MLSLGELRELGLSRQAVSVRAGNGRLHRLYRAVYAVGHPNPGFEGRMLAAVKACGPNAVLSHHSAAELWGFMERTDRSPDVTIPASERRGHAGIGVHQSTRLEPRDRAKFEGIPVTTPARTLLDLAAVLEYRVLRGAVRRAEGLHRASPAQLEEVLDRLRPRRGARRLAAIVATGPAPTNSKLEDLVLELVLAGGLAHPDLNKPLVLDGRRVVPDFRWPEQRLVIEADGAAWHDGKVAREEDAARQALLEAHGERVLRVTWRQVVDQPQRTLTRIRRAGAPRAVRVAGL